MVTSFEQRSQRWVLRRLRRRMQRRPIVVEAAPPRIVSAASIVDGYPELFGVACNDRTAVAPTRPTLTIVRG